MWVSKEPGRLNCDSREKLCALLGGSPETLSPLLDELIRKGAATSNHPGELICRRIYSQANALAKLKQTRSKAGSKGGSKRAENLAKISDTSEFCYENQPSKNVTKIAPSSSFAIANPKSNHRQSTPAPAQIKHVIDDDNLNMIKIGSHFQIPKSRMDSIIIQDGPKLFGEIVEKINNHCSTNHNHYKNYEAAYKTTRKNMQKPQQKPQNTPDEDRSGTPERRIITARNDDRSEKHNPDLFRQLLKSKNLISDPPEPTS